MKVVFRTDASLPMGSGHVMRCITLADALKAQGAQCHFISREHPGHLLAVIRQRGHEGTGLPAALPGLSTALSRNASDPNQEPAHAAWLGCGWAADAEQTANILAAVQPDWLVVDHYALDHRWEEAVAPNCRKLLVIDDLADRAHKCDLLLDQNLGRQAQDYASLVPATCRVFTGPRYALLRPEFAALRDYSLKRRADAQHKQIKQVLITMGGVDLDNATGQVLAALKACPLPADCRITVVMGTAAPWLAQVRELAEQMPWPTNVLVNIADMAQRMADSDLAIGAAGSTSWERCCLGLPTLMVVLAENQREAATHIQNAGAAHCFALNSSMQEDLKMQLQSLVNSPALLSQMATCASAVTNGFGVDHVVTAIAELLNNRY